MKRKIRKKFNDVSFFFQVLIEDFFPFPPWMKSNQDPIREESEDELTKLRRRLNSVAFGCANCRKANGDRMSRTEECECSKLLNSQGSSITPTPPTSPQPKDLLRRHLKQKRNSLVTTMVESDIEIRLPELVSHEIRDVVMLEPEIRWESDRNDDNSTCSTASVYGSDTDSDLEDTETSLDEMILSSSPKHCRKRKSIVAHTTSHRTTSRPKFSLV